jgi:hypothetical protein
MDHQPNTKSRRFGVARCSALLAALLAAASACSASADEQLGSRAEPIAGGSADLSHKNVFLLARETMNSGALCTATLIAPNLLLTARHCVSPGTGDDQVQCGNSLLQAPYPASAFFATNDAQPRNGSPFFGATEVRVPSQGEDTCGYDVALIILSKNVPADISVPAVPRIDREVQPGEEYTAVGYGVNASGDSNHGRMELDGLTIACQPGSCGDGVEASEFRGETGICSGDSGGPALDADGKVVGVVSRGGPDCSTPIYGTVTAWQDFIIDTAKDAALLGAYEPPFWVTTRQSDPPLLAGGGGGAAGDAPLGREGEACDEANLCGPGLACYVSGNGATASCTATCTTAAECATGQSCQSAGDISVCVRPSGGADESGGCSVSKSRSPSLLGSVLAACGVSLVFARRRAARRLRSA